MAKYAIEGMLPGNGAWGSGVAARETLAKAWWSAFRDDFVATLPSPDFLVGDIFRWQGAAGKYGHGFVIRHATIGEWLIMGSADGNDTSSSNAYLSSLLQTTWTSYLRRVSGSPTSTVALYCGMAFCFNPNPAATWAIGYNSSLELSGGDWTAPTQNPYTAFAAFWGASFAPFGLIHADYFFDYRNDQYFHFLIDDFNEFMRIDLLAQDGAAGTSLGSPSSKGVCLHGNCFGSYADRLEGGLSDSGDTNRALNSCTIISQGSVSPGTSTYNKRGFEEYNVAYVMALDGVTRLSDTVISPVKDMTLTNYKDTNGRPKHRMVEVKSGSVIKGTLKKRIALEVGAYRHPRLHKTRIEYPAGSGNILVIEHESCAFCWLDDKSPYPYECDLATLP